MGSEGETETMSLESKICFVIMPIGEKDSEIRRRADNVYNYVICAALSEVNYQGLRADEIATPGQITNQIVEHILQDSLVIADLAGGNPNVFYELALRHVTRKPYIMLAKKDERLPFDILQTRTTFFDETDLRSVDHCKKEIVRTIRELEFENIKTPIENPISLVLDMISLKTTVGQTEDYLRSIFHQLMSMSSKLSPYLVAPLSVGSISSTYELMLLESRLESIHTKLQELSPLSFSLSLGTSPALYMLESRLDSILEKIRQIKSFNSPTF